MECATVSFSGGGGLKFWLENYSTATQTNVSFTPKVADANVSAVIKPKGTGALLASIPDGTTVGGNARGTYAVDLQMVRNNANQVASAGYSVIVGGIYNRNACGYAFLGGGFSNSLSGTADYTIVVGGQGNAINTGASHIIVGGESNSITFGSHGFIGGGQSNTAGNGHSVVTGGRSNTAGSGYSAVGGGQTNNASGTHSVISGGQSNTASGTWAKIGGGKSNAAAGYYNFIGGGFTNSATANAAVTTQATTTVTSGSTAVTLSASNASIKIGQYITGTGIASDTYVANISGTTLTLSQNATASGTPTLSFFTPHGVVVGGGNNQATGMYSFIGGGGDAGNTANRNTASGDWSTVVGGRLNTASGFLTFVGGGQNNRATNTYSAVVGGIGNVSDDRNGGFIGGGEGNSIGNNRMCAILGGNGNSIGGGDIRSSIAGGLLNSLSTFEQGFIGGGQQNTVNGNAFIVGGYLNVAGSFSGKNFIGAGESNTANASYSLVVGGLNNTASGAYSAILGGARATANLYGQQAYAAGRFSANGDAQAHELIWRRAITGTATTELFLDGASIAAILPATNAVWHGIIDISSICTVQGVGTTIVGDVAATSYKVTIKRIGTNTSLVGSVQEIGTLNADVSMAAVAFLIGANDTNESLQIAFTPPPTAGADTVIRVVATFRGQQIQY